MNFRSSLRSLLSLAHLIDRPALCVRFVADNPDRDMLAPGTLYIVGDKNFQKWAVMRCPCGCGDPIMLSLSKSRRPSWTADVDWLERPTLDPSIRQTSGCYSHFWVQGGRLVWCGDTGKPWRAKGRLQ